MPVISYYTYLLQLTLVTIVLHRKLFVQMAGIFGALSLILIVLEGRTLLDQIASLTGGMLAMLGYTW